MLSKREKKRAVREALRQLAKENLWTVVHEFNDMGVTRYIYKIKPNPKRPNTVTL